MRKVCSGLAAGGAHHNQHGYSGDRGQRYGLSTLHLGAQQIPPHPQACPLPGPPFSRPQHLAVTPLPFCAPWCCKSRSQGTELPLRLSGKQANLGTMVWLPPSCTGLRPPFQLASSQFTSFGERGTWDTSGRRPLQGCAGQCSVAPSACSPPTFIWKSATFSPNGRIDNPNFLGPVTCHIPSQLTGSGPERTPVGLSSRQALQTGRSCHHTSLLGTPGPSLPELPAFSLAPGPALLFHMPWSPFKKGLLAEMPGLLCPSHSHSLGATLPLLGLLPPSQSHLQIPSGLTPH